jgi:hypothetical protein
MSMTELDHPHLPTDHGFQKGPPRFGGRKKGSRNRFGSDLREAVVAGIAEVGFIEKAEDGPPDFSWFRRDTDREVEGGAILRSQGDQRNSRLIRLVPKEAMGRRRRRAIPALVAGGRAAGTSLAVTFVRLLLLGSLLPGSSSATAQLFCLGSAWFFRCRYSAVAYAVY